jgi:hypothetical protein
VLVFHGLVDKTLGVILSPDDPCIVSQDQPDHLWAQVRDHSRVETYAWSIIQKQAGGQQKKDMGLMERRSLAFVVQIVRVSRSEPKPGGVPESVTTGRNSIARAQ